MTMQEMVIDLRKKMARAIIVDILKNCHERNRGLASALDGYNAIRESLNRCRIGMRPEHVGPNIVSFTLYDEIDGEELDSTIVEFEKPNSWLTVHQLLKKYDGEPYSIEICNMNADRLYYTDDVSAIYSDINIELLLGLVLDYKEVDGNLTIILES